MKIQLSRTVGTTEQHRIIPTGYSWTTALFGPIPSVVRRCYLHALAIAVACFFTYGLVGVVVAFFINKFQIKMLLAEGWRIADEEQRRFVEDQLKLSTNPPPPDPSNDQAAALWKSLKDSVAPSTAAGPTGLPKTGLLQNRPFVISFAAINIGLVLSAVWLLPGLSLWLPFLGFGGALVSLVFAKALAIRAHGVKTIDPAQPGSDGARDLYAMVAELSKRAGLPAIPEVGVYESPDLNAFATGMNRSNALVAFSSGLLEKMPVDQIRAVAAHEIAHIANQDMLGMVLLQGVINSLVIMFSLPLQGLRLLNFLGDGYSYFIELCLWLFQILVTLFLMFLGSLVMKAFSRSREYRADAFAADLLGKESMVGALKSIAMDTAEIPVPQRAYAALKVSGRFSIAEVFSTHPLTEKRIQALEQATYMTPIPLSVTSAQPAEVALPPATE